MGDREKPENMAKWRAEAQEQFAAESAMPPA